MNPTFRGAVSDDQRNRRFPEVIVAYQANIKLNIKSQYVTIDILDQELANHENLDILIDEDVALGEERLSLNNLYRQHRFIYEQQEGSCRFSRYGVDAEEAEIVYHVNFIQLAVSDFLYLCTRDKVGYFFIDCNTDTVDDAEKERCLRNRQLAFSALESELLRVNPELKISLLRLRIENLNELLLVLRYVTEEIGEIFLLGLHVERDNYERIELQELANNQWWRETVVFKTRYLICMASSEDYVHFYGIETEVQTLTIEDIDRLTQKHSEIPEEVVNIIIKSRDDIDLDEIEGPIDESMLVLLPQRELQNENLIANFVFKERRLIDNVVRRVYRNRLEITEQ